MRVLSAGPGLMVNPDHPAIRVAAKAFSDIFGKPTVFMRSGGSIPIVGDFATHLGIPTILMGFGLPDDGLHSPNEKYQSGELLQGHHDDRALLRGVRGGCCGATCVNGGADLQDPLWPTWTSAAGLESCPTDLKNILQSQLNLPRRLIAVSVGGQHLPKIRSPEHMVRDIEIRMVAED